MSETKPEEVYFLEDVKDVFVLSARNFSIMSAPKITVRVIDSSDDIFDLELRFDDGNIEDQIKVLRDLGTEMHAVCDSLEKDWNSCD